MDYTILHDIPGRLRVHCPLPRLSRHDAAAIGGVLSMQDGILHAAMSPRTGNLLIHYSRVAPKEHILALIAVLEPDDWDGFGDLGEPPPSIVEMSVRAIAGTALSTLVRWLLLPPVVRHGLILLEAVPSFLKGLRSLRERRLDVAALDAAALTILTARRDFNAIRTILWMFDAADALEFWTREQSRKNLADSLALKVDAVWVRTPRGDVKRPMAEVRPGDLLVIHTGSVIPVDGLVVEGEALVNQSVLTGESETCLKNEGVSVFAGTVVDEGMIVVQVEKLDEETRLQGIVAFIEESESLKAGIQSKAEHLADGIVPYSLLASLAVLIVTRDPLRASALLMVDYSCAIRMSTPLTVLSAIQEGVKNNILVKGGKYMEAMAKADSLVIDKTGTLTMAKPSVAAVIAFGEWNETEVLRTAACIEEHFPHPVGRAVVRKAEQENLRHRERHAKPEYILAHGIVSRLDRKQILIGSGHFIFDDMKVKRTAAAARAANREAKKGRSLLYMAHDGELAGIIAIEDPVREDAAETLDILGSLGVHQVTMLTGDGDKTAAAVAARLGIDSYRANLLPVDKAEIIGNLQLHGRTVLFAGDGINDSPALAAADVGVSLKDGADIAKEVSGVVLMDGSLRTLTVARQLATGAMTRIERQFSFILGINSVLIGLGLFGFITPRLAALIHNLGTVVVTANSVRRLLPEPDPAALTLPPLQEEDETEDVSGPLQRGYDTA